MTTRRSTTRHVLRWLLVSLLVTTLVMFGTTLWVFHRLHATAKTVHSDTAPAVLELSLARVALTRADREAVNSFGTGQSQLTGPGAEYQNQIAIASQSLTRVAGHNAAGEAGSRILQLVNGLLVTYTSLIGQADVHHRRVGGSELGTAYLWYASRLLHTARTGILAQLDLLLDTHRRVLEDRVTASAVSPWIVVLLGVPILGLFGLLLAAMVVLRRRFRRVLNPPLLLATATLLLGMGFVVLQVFVSDGRMDASRETLYQAVDDWQTQTFVTDGEGQRKLAELVVELCGGQVSSCGHTVTEFVADVDGVRAADDVDDNRLTAATQTVSEKTEAAGANARFESLIYVAAVLIGASVLLGFLPRIDEYRYRPR